MLEGAPIATVLPSLLKLTDHPDWSPAASPSISPPNLSQSLKIVVTICSVISTEPVIVVSERTVFPTTFKPPFTSNFTDGVFPIPTFPSLFITNTSFPTALFK